MKQTPCISGLKAEVLRRFRINFHSTDIMSENHSGFITSVTEKREQEK
jgi:hypothetical protein